MRNLEVGEFSEIKHYIKEQESTYYPCTQNFQEKSVTIIHSYSFTEWWVVHWVDWLLFPLSLI